MQLLKIYSRMHVYPGIQLLQHGCFYDCVTNNVTLSYHTEHAEINRNENVYFLLIAKNADDGCHIQDSLYWLIS